MATKLAKTSGRQSKYKSVDASTSAAQQRMRSRIKELEANISASRCASPAALAMSLWVSHVRDVLTAAVAVSGRRVGACSAWQAWGPGRMSGLSAWRRRWPASSLHAWTS